MLFETATIIFALQYMQDTQRNQEIDVELISKVALAIANVTRDPQEVETLIRISRWESGGYRKEVANCKVKGDHGDAHGLFQVHPWTAAEAVQACSDNYEEQARLALFRVRESKRMCQSQGRRGSDLLAGYTKGSCAMGEPEAKLRWGNGKTLTKLMVTEE